MSTSFQFLHALVIVPLALLPIINPLSGAPVFMMTAGDDPVIARRFARQVAINCWVVIVAAMLAGTYLLALFGLSLPIVRLGGGLLVAMTGWRMLNRQDDDDVRKAVVRGQPSTLSEEEIVRRSFFPITFPLTTGPGTIAASIAIGTTLPRHPTQWVLGALVSVAGATITVAVVYLVYRNAAALLGKLGEIGTMVMMRLIAFVLLCIGLEIMWAGWAELNGIGAH